MTAIMWFIVTQGHYFRYQSKACMWLPINLHSTSHCFQDIVEYWSNFCWQKGVFLLHICAGWTNEFRFAKFGLNKLESLFYGIMQIISWTIWTWLTSVTDGQTFSYHAALNHVALPKIMESFNCTKTIQFNEKIIRSIDAITSSSAIAERPRCRVG